MTKAVAAIAAGALFLGTTGTAWACRMRPPCASDALPPEGASIPSNAPALVTWNSWRAEVDTLELVRESDGHPVDALRGSDSLSRSTFLLPSAPLAPGERYLLRYSSPCDQGATLQERRFLATAPATLPTRQGEAVVGRRSTLVTHRVNADCSDGGPNAAYATVGIDLVPTEELKPFLSLAATEVRVGGETVAWGNYGALTLDPRTNRVESAWTVDTRCEPLWPEGKTRPGTNEVELLLHIAGASVDPEPIKLSVDIDCTGVVLPAKDSSDGCTQTPTGALSALALLLLARRVPATPRRRA